MFLVQPDIGFVSGDVEAFKTINLYDTALQVLEAQTINGWYNRATNWSC